MIPGTKLFGRNRKKVQLSDQSLSVSGDGFHPVSVDYQLTNTGLVKSGGSTLEAWLLSGSASLYEVRATLFSGSVSGTFGSWIALSGGASWSASAGADEVNTTSISVEIRRVGTTTVLASATVFMDAINGAV